MARQGVSVSVPARMSPGLPHSPHSRLTVCCLSASYHFLHSPGGAGNSSWYKRSCSGVRLAYRCVHALIKSPAAPVRQQSPAKAALLSLCLPCDWSGSSSHGGRRSRSVRQRRPVSSSAALSGAQVSLGSASRSCVTRGEERSEGGRGGRRIDGALQRAIRRHRAAVAPAGRAWV
jgi:hypothetical protein